MSTDVDLGVPAGEQADASSRTRFTPKPPATLAEAGLTDGMVDAIIFKCLLLAGSRAGEEIAATLGLMRAIVTERLADLKRQNLVGYVGAAGAGDFTYTLSDTGRERARRLMDESMYIGTAPVDLRSYVASIRAQSITRERPAEAQLREAFHDLLINPRMFATLGPAINSGRGMFLYGYPGNGKTSIAERITRCFGSEIYIPRTIHIDGFIIKLFDAELHEEVRSGSAGDLRLSKLRFKPDEVDQRWVRIKRPTVVVGGELTMDQLEVRYNATTRISEASTQLKSNCGTLVIDDFGRQRMPPIELLNRWIVPLEKRYDFLGLANGQKIQVPFDQLLIFSTNLEPKDLVDEAFLRRIPYKINVVDPTEAEFRELFKIMCRVLEFEHREDVVGYLIAEYYKKTGRPFRCCQPRDMLLLVKNQCQYCGEPPELTRENIDFATSVYFTVL